MGHPIEKLFQRALFKLNVNIVELRLLFHQVLVGLFNGAQTIRKLWLLEYATTAVKAFAHAASTFLKLRMENCMSALNAIKIGIV